MAQLNQTQLERLLRKVDRSQPVTFEAHTVPDLMANAKDGLSPRENPFRCPCCNAPTVVKIRVVNAWLNTKYSRAVNRQRLREASEDDSVHLFEAERRKWGEKVAGTPLIEHKSKLYLDVKREKILTTRFVYWGSAHEAGSDGFALVERFLRPRIKSSRQGVNREVVVRDYSLANLRQITIGGASYKVKPPRRKKIGGGTP